MFITAFQSVSQHVSITAFPFLTYMVTTWSHHQCSKLFLCINGLTFKILLSHHENKILRFLNTRKETYFLPEVEAQEEGEEWGESGPSKGREAGCLSGRAGKGWKAISVPALCPFVVPAVPLLLCCNLINKLWPCFYQCCMCMFFLSLSYICNFLQVGPLKYVRP